MENILESLLKRSPNQYDSYQDTVNEILNEVKEKGDEALFRYTKKFDKAEITPDNIRVTGGIRTGRGIPGRSHEKISGKYSGFS